MRNYNQPADALVRALINNQSVLPTPVRDTNLIFGQPSALLESPDGHTQVATRGIQGSEFSNQTTTLIYDRLDLGVLFQGAYQPKLTTLAQSSLHRLLPKLNRLLGTHLTTRDVEDIDLVQLGEGAEVTLELRARPGSLAYTGFTRILFHRRWLMLTDVVDVTVMDVYAHPDPVLEGHLSAGLLTWGQDFTLIAPYLKVDSGAVDYRGEWTNHPETQNQLASNYGIENWPLNSQSRAGELDDFDTREVANANTDYQRVVVQSDIRANGLVGTAYFHYNL